MASISHFMPVSNADPSARVIQNDAYLLPPLFELPTWDLFRHAIEDRPSTPVSTPSTNTFAEIKTIDQLMTLKNVASFGRPLWYAYYRLIEEDEDKEFQKNLGFKYLIKFAKKKLSCNLKIDFSSGVHDSETLNCFALALISCRAVVNLNPVSVFTSRLVADFMAICLNVNDTRSQMIVTYGSEPILAEASAQICFENNKHIFSKAVDQVKETVTQGEVDQGQVGELAARLIILNAIDSAAAASSRKKIEGFSHLVPITVREFLRHFVGECVVTSIENKRTVRLFN